MGDVANQPVQEPQAEPVLVGSEPTPQAVNDPSIVSAAVEPVINAEGDNQTTVPTGSEPVEPPKTEFDSDKMRGELITQRRKRQDAERELEYYKSQQQPKPAESQPTENQKPKIEDFEDYEDFEDAKTRFVTNQTINETFKARQEQEYKQTIDVAYQNRMTEAMVKNPGLSEKIQSSKLPDQVVVAMQKNGTIQEIKESVKGPEIAGYLADNPEVTYKIASMDDRQVIREIARIEARLSTPNQQPTTNKTSQAPPPIVPNAGSGSNPSKQLGDMTDSEFAAYRNKQQFGA